MRQSERKLFKKTKNFKNIQFAYILAFVKYFMQICDSIIILLNIYLCFVF